MAEYRKREAAAAEARSGATSLQLEEEEAMRSRREAEERKQRSYNDMVRQMLNKDKVDEMRHQQLLRAEAQIAFKSGDLAKARKLEARMKPDKLG
mmetsp:Transcript_30535/g.97431  ORF Transcript_30535/g.97431 Transcript_30535/m.97431 type:complete len:95 (+) Transcript_30535:421-705(+)